MCFSRALSYMTAHNHVKHTRCGFSLTTTCYIPVFLIMFGVASIFNAFGSVHIILKPGISNSLEFQMLVVFIVGFATCQINKQLLPPFHVHCKNRCPLQFCAAHRNHYWFPWPSQLLKDYAPQFCTKSDSVFFLFALFRFSGP